MTLKDGDLKKNNLKVRLHTRKDFLRKYKVVVSGEISLARNMTKIIQVLKLILVHFSASGMTIDDDFSSCIVWKRVV